MSTLIVCPTFNERDNLADLVATFFAVGPQVDLLIVDDDSPDGTADLCADLMAGFSRLDLLPRRGPRGLGKAYTAGLLLGLERGYERIGTMDADLSHDPVHLPALMTAIVAGADLAIGSRYVPGGGTVNWGLRRRLLSRSANTFAAMLLGIPAHDVTSGYRLYRGELLRRIGLRTIRSTGYSFLVELAYRAHLLGARFAERPIVFVDRRMGVSKLRSREIYRGMFALLTLRLAPPRLDHVRAP